jgi:hypothetical protein
MQSSKHDVDGSEISESGTATGTYDVPVTAGLTLHAKYVAAIINVFLKGGRVTATSNVDFTETGFTVSFHGTLKIVQGTGVYTHASGELQFKGAFNHSTFDMWAVTSGSATY